MSEATSLEPRPFDCDESVDPEAAAIVAKLLDSCPGGRWRPSDIGEIEKLDGGADLMRKDPEWNVRGLLAIAEQGRHWQGEYARLRQRANEVDITRRPDVCEPLQTRLLTLGAASTLIARRRLPISDEQLVQLIEAAIDGLPEFWRGIEPASAVKQAENVAKDRGLAPAPIDALVRLRSGITGARVWEGNKVQARIDKLLAANRKDDAPPLPPGPPPRPAPAGSDHVLVDFKVRIAALPSERSGDVPVREIATDGFLLRDDSPLVGQHELITRFLASAAEGRNYHEVSLGSAPEGGDIRAMTDAERGRLLLAACERAAAAVEATDDYSDPLRWKARSAARSLPEAIAGAGVELDRDGWFDALLLARWIGREAASTGVEKIAETISDAPLTPGERHVLHRVRCTDIDQPPLGVCPPLAARICALLGESDGYWFVPGEHWADHVHSDLSAMDDEARGRWFALLEHVANATAGSPKAAWRKAAGPPVAAIGASRFQELVAGWLASVARGRAEQLVASWGHGGLRNVDTIDDVGATALRGLVWLLADFPTNAAPRQVADLLLTCVKKVPGVGPRAVKVANACIWTLGEMATADDAAIRDGGLGQLARLKARVSFKTTLKAIEKAYAKAAEAAGMAREDLEELGVPAFGFENGGQSHAIGGAQVTYTVTGNKVLREWTNDKGKTVKSAPAKVKREHKDEVKELEQRAKDAEGILTAGRDRLDTMFLADKSWPVSVWRERYLDHGLIGTIAQRLIWWIGDQAVLCDRDGATDVDGKPVRIDGDLPVRLWHPATQDADQVQAWRARLEQLEITQPFKQAHREIYLLTDAERQTEVYSNRFAAHVLKQHQFNALCGARGWNNQLRLMVDDDFPPASREIAAYGLRAEFWVEGVGDQYGRDTNETGTFHYLASDQVRFYRVGAATNWAHAGGGGYGSGARGPGEDEINEPVPLERIPALVLSEVLRDVDLFVGVASVGNDPNWSDGGPEGRYQQYWHDYSFGDLSATAQTRKQILERLVPKLKIAKQCSFDDKFLVVEGKVRSYKIHLGSGNILMKPNDEYLCIVPKSSAVASASNKVFLPFEGDRTLAIVLSKAFLLAADDKIKDTTILTQIGR